MQEEEEKKVESKILSPTVIGQKYVVKVMKNYRVDLDDRYQRTIRKEIDLEARLLAIDHPNIIKMYEFRDVGTALKSDTQESPLLYQVFEYAEIGTLYDLLVG